MTTRDYTPIDCGLYDHLELACLRRYRLHIVTVAGELRGTACTTRTDADRCEWLVLEVDGASREVRLDDLRSIEPLDGAADFGRIEFAPANGALPGTR